MTQPDYRPPRYSDAPMGPEFSIREVLINGFAELRNATAQLSEFVSRFDNLPQGSQAEWNDQLREALADVLDPESDNSLRNISLGYPSGDAALPWIGITISSDAEDTGSATIGDNMLTLYHGIGDAEIDPENYRLIRKKVKGVDYNASIEVSVWSTSPEMSLMLHEAVNYILMGNKGELTASGIRDITLSSSAFEPSSELEPRMSAVVPVTRCVLTYQRRWTQTTDPVPTLMEHRFVFRSE